MDTGETRKVGDMLEDILRDRGVPRNIKSSVEESIRILGSKDPEDQKIATIIEGDHPGHSGSDRFVQLHLNRVDLELLEISKRSHFLIEPE